MRKIIYYTWNTYTLPSQLILVFYTAFKFGLSSLVDLNDDIRHFEACPCDYCKGRLKKFKAKLFLSSTVIYLLTYTLLK